jgi:hypothetical protein
MIARRSTALLFAGLLAGDAAQAEIEGQGFPVGPFRAYPSLGIDFTHEDNYFRAGTNNLLLADGTVVRLDPGILSTWVNELTPGIRLSALKGPDAYNLFYEARIGTVFDSHDDNYVDHRFNANANWELGLRHRLRAEYEFMSWHDRRGTGDPSQTSRLNFGKHPDTWRSNRGDLFYSFGAPGAKGRFDFRGAYLARRYTNNDQDDRDNDRGILDGTFYARVLPKTSLLFEVRWEDIDYIRSGGDTLDSQEWRVYGGAAWDATAKTTGAVRLGWLEKDFKESFRDDVSDFGWEVDLRWKPRTYSTFDLVTKRAPAESANGLSDTVVVSSVKLDWIHYWKQNLYTKVTGFATDDDYNGTSRNDNRYHLGAGIFLKPRRWFEVGAEYRYETRDSNVTAADLGDEVMNPEDLVEYTNNVFMLTLRARL